ncbi:MAG: hypothetical protein MPN21_06460 [Thermoanaerobaculia bacterium]|nr:hypothetical protein [Thermoanaerobaculia bacterium]
MTDRLGDFEYTVLLATLRLEDDAYGVSIRGEIERAQGAKCRWERSIRPSNASKGKASSAVEWVGPPRCAVADARSCVV